MKFPRVRLIALLLVAIFSFAAVGTVTVASADDASIAKKCKKGYKKVGKKCKKKKKKAVAKQSDTVASVSLASLDNSAYGAELIGTVTLKKPVTSLKLIAYRSKGGQDFPRETTVQSDGLSLTISFKVRAAPVTMRDRSKAPTTYWVVADGVKSNTLK